MRKCINNVVVDEGYTWGRAAMMATKMAVFKENIVQWHRDYEI